jgi:hypothetical protein
MRSRLLTWSRTLDLNYLYQRHQVSLFMAEHASSETVRQIHREFGQRYAARIEHAKLRQLGASAA